MSRRLVFVFLICLNLIRFEVNCQPFLLPPSFENGRWTSMDTQEDYVGQELILRQENNPEIFFEYGFEMLSTRYYTAEQALSIQADLFTMKDPSAAFGVFSYFQRGSGTSMDIGNQGILQGNELFFWKGPYFVRLLGKGNNGINQSLMILAGEINQSLPGNGHKPGIMSVFSNSTADKTRYFRGPLALGPVSQLKLDLELGYQEGAIAFTKSYRALVLQFVTRDAATNALVLLHEKVSARSEFKDPLATSTGLFFQDKKGMHYYFEVYNTCIIAYISEDRFNNQHVLNQLKLHLDARKKPANT
jgi:hypothetical protein